MAGTFAKHHFSFQSSVFGQITGKRLLPNIMFLWHLTIKHQKTKNTFRILSFKPEKVADSMNLEGSATLVGGFSPFEKYKSNWIISKGRGYE